MIYKFIDSIKDQPPHTPTFGLSYDNYERGLNRPLLLQKVEKAKNTKNTAEYIDAIKSILEWGGIRKNHFDKAKNSIELKIDEIIRVLNISNIEERFNAFRGLINCVDASFFTKIIFFFDPNNSIILDKWVSFSLFSIFKSPSITKFATNVTPTLYGYKHHLSKKGILSIPRIHRHPTGKEYMQAISDAKDLLKIVSSNFPNNKLTLEDIEIALFSFGRGKGIWRNNVITYMKDWAIREYQNSAIKEINIP